MARGKLKFMQPLDCKIIYCIVKHSKIINNKPKSCRSFATSLEARKAFKQLPDQSKYFLSTKIERN